MATFSENKMKENKTNKVIAITGSTASGKSKIALKLAKKFGGEIVCADSRQIYKKIDIGTAKPSEKEKQAVPHHLFGFLDLDKEFNAFDYKKIAEEKIREIQKRGGIPFLVGGTGLYIRAVCENFNFPGGGKNKKLRRELEEKKLEELKKIAKKSGIKLKEDNKRRIIRKIEIAKSSFNEQSFSNNFDVLYIGVYRKREELKKRIRERVKKMLKAGLKKEARNLFSKYGKDNPILNNTIGCKEWLPYFEGESSAKETIERIIINTNQYSKRQMTWFRKNKKINWVEDINTAEKIINSFL